MHKYLSIFLLTFITLTGCSSDSDPVSGGEKTYDVQYKVTPASAEINQIRYLNAAGDTLKEISVSSTWSYTWATKGKSGDDTFIEITLVNTSGKAYVQILANNSALVSDSLGGIIGGTTSLTRAVSLPY